MTNKFTPIIVLCEGISEFNYIQNLNRILSNPNTGSAAFKPYTINTGRFAQIRQKFNQVKKDNKNCSVQIWVDKDLYINNSEFKKLYLNKGKMPDFLFSIMNFEDFLMLHCHKDLLYSWQEICSSNNHFYTPMTSRIYCKELQKFFPEYRKGCIPFDITSDVLKTLFGNLKDDKIQIKNDFAVFLEKLILEERLVFI